VSVVITQITDTIKGRQTINPKTVLGFYATVLGILLAGGVSATGFLATTDTATWLLPWILGFCAGVFVLLLVGVFAITLIDPSKLMLSQVSGTEYAAIQQRVILGDSTSGERVEIISPEPAALPTVEVIAVSNHSERTSGNGAVTDA
jgi:hypothetical protein